jgi:hypothetical protein
MHANIRRPTRCPTPVCSGSLDRPMRTASGTPRRGCDERPRGHQACGRRVRWGAHRAGPLGGPAVLDDDGAGGARLRTCGCAPHCLVRVAHYARWNGCVLAQTQSVREGLRFARAAATTASAGFLSATTAPSSSAERTDAGSPSLSAVRSPLPRLDPIARPHGSALEDLGAQACAVHHLLVHLRMQQARQVRAWFAQADAAQTRHS